MQKLRITTTGGADVSLVMLSLEGAGATRTAQVKLEIPLDDSDREDLRWYLEDYLAYPVDPAPAIAARIEERIRSLGIALFDSIFRADDDTRAIWSAIASGLAQTRIEIAAGQPDAPSVPWELLRDPASDGVLAVRARSFVRTHSQPAQPPQLSSASAGSFRVLLVICRPGGARDVPFRSVAGRLIRLTSPTRDDFQLDVLRPPTFSQLTRVLDEAQRRGEPYHVVHFDGHGVHLDSARLQDGALPFTVVSPPRPGHHGYLVFEDPDDRSNRQLVDGPSLGNRLADGGVLALVMNACRSAQAGLAPKPGDVPIENAHERVRAYGSLAQEVMDAGLGGVVAMRYNVYVVTAARFVAELYTQLARGRELAEAVTTGRRQLFVDPYRQVTLDALPLQDWIVPTVYEAAPLALKEAPREGVVPLRIEVQQPGERSHGPAILTEPDVGFIGRDETVLALDRAFDDHAIVLLHAWAGSGKTATAAEFSRWYARTGGVPAGNVVVTSFARFAPLSRALADFGSYFASELAAAGVTWEALDHEQRRAATLQFLGQRAVLWVWDNVELIAGFPAGTPSAWSDDEQAELARFLRDARTAGGKFLLTSRREERNWLGDLAFRVELIPMPMLERAELSRAIAASYGRKLIEVEDWIPLLKFSQGNPLTITALVGQAFREGLSTRAEVHSFVEKLRLGLAEVSDDEEQGRSRSLAASLKYGFDNGFSVDEKASLALLHLYEGFVDVDVLAVMRIALEAHDRELEDSRNELVLLLDRASEVGILDSCGVGYYSIHPAIPWFFQQLFEESFSQKRRQEVEVAFAESVRQVATFWTHRYISGSSDAVNSILAEEANIRSAIAIVRRMRSWGAMVDLMQALQGLYFQTGRAGEWRRLLEELEGDVINPATGQPQEGADEIAVHFYDWQRQNALQRRDLETAERLARANVESLRARASESLEKPAVEFDEIDALKVLNLATSHRALGQVLASEQDPAAVDEMREARRLCELVGHTQEAAGSASAMGVVYLDVGGVQDLDEAEKWFEIALSETDESDAHGRADIVEKLGTVELRRFRQMTARGADSEALGKQLHAAAARYHEALDLLPPHAAPSRAVIHHQLGHIYRLVDRDIAAEHLRESIRYEEMQENRFGAGQTRAVLAMMLAELDPEKALLYARAALRDFDDVAPNLPHAKHMEELIEKLESPSTD